MKKIGLLFATVITIMMFAFSVNALEPTGQCGENVYWSFDEITGALTIGGEGDMFNYEELSESPFHDFWDIKSVVIDEGVTNIGVGIFNLCINVESVTIPDSVTEIGEDAFFACYKLVSINIPKSVENIDRGAFRYCYSLKSITVDENNEYFSIDEYGVLFNKDKTELIQYPSGNDRKEYIIPNTVVTIGSFAFNCSENLETITIPYSVTKVEDISSYLGTHAFYNCDNLVNIVVDKNNDYYANDEYGVLFNKDKTELIRYPAGNARKEYTIPNTVVKICDSSFSDSDNLEKIIIPDSVIYLGTDAFAGCSNLTSLIIPNSITRIYPYAFQHCYNLTKIMIPNSIVDVEYSAFDSCIRLTDVYYSGSEEQWNYIDISEKNTSLINATIHFNHKHIYFPILNLPPCMVQNNVVYMCECGDNYIGNYTDITNEHAYSSQITTPATHLTEGVETFTCACGDRYTKPIAKLEKHSYSSKITKPATHLAEGIETFTCACGDSYTEPIAKLTVHTYIEQITKHPTHFEEGLKTLTCECGYSYTERIEKTKEHIYTVSNIVAPTCEDKGYTVYVCGCGHSYNSDKTSATGHNYEGDNCKICGESKIENCSCNCHKSGFMGFIWKILRFFYKLFKINSVCTCGVAHY